MVILTLMVLILLVIVVATSVAIGIALLLSVPQVRHACGEWLKRAAPWGLALCAVALAIGPSHTTHSVRGPAEAPVLTNHNVTERELSVLSPTDPYLTERDLSDGAPAVRYGDAAATVPPAQTGTTARPVPPEHVVVPNIVAFPMFGLVLLLVILCMAGLGTRPVVHVVRHRLCPTGHRPLSWLVPAIFGCGLVASVVAIKYLSLEHVQVTPARSAQAAAAARVITPAGISALPQPPLQTALERPHADSPETPGTDISPSVPSAAAATTPVRMIVFQGEATSGVVVTQPPAWVSESPTADPARDTERFVLVSSRYADVAEAEADLLAQLQPRLAEYLDRSGLRVAPEQLQWESLRTAGVRLARLQEQFDVEVGAFTQPVYRISWLISLAPSARQALEAALRLAKRGERLWLLGLGCGLLTLLFGSWATYFRVDDRTQGRYRGRLQLAALAANAAAIAGVMLLA